MNRKKSIYYLLGVSYALCLLVGLLFLAAPEGVSTAAAITVIVLSLASGLILPNPISFWYLLAGVLMLVLPTWCVSLILCCISAAGMIVVPLLYFHK